MDIITHSLAAFLVKRIKPKETSPLSITIPLFVGALIPDIGELVIQRALAKKYGEKLAVYDDRTSDIDIANQIEVTWLYDSLHSLTLPMFLILYARFFVKGMRIKSAIYFFSIGLFTHTFLDCFTHGKVWALKLFYPISNHRFRLCENSVGNWWDWTPKFKLPLLSFDLPIYCPIIWLAILLVSIIFYYKKQNL